jgi:hypothetical protein
MLLECDVLPRHTVPESTTKSKLFSASSLVEEQPMMIPPLAVPVVAEKLAYSVLKPVLMRLGEWILRLWGLCARYRKTSLTTSLVLIVMASLALLKYRERSNIYTSVVDSTLCRETEPTAQKFKGLEAFLITAFAPNVDGVLRKSLFAEEFLNRCEELKDTIKSFENLDAVNLADRKLDLKISRAATKGVVLTDTCTKSYLFLPVNVFRHGLSSKQMLEVSGNPAFNKNVECQTPFKEIIDGDTAIQDDIRFSRYVADVLESFTSIPVTDNLVDLPAAEVHGKPAQVSLITKNGVNRIYNAQRGELEKYYGSLFPADQFFPSRPYFRRAFQQGRSGSVDKVVPKDGQTLGDYFYVSHPYVDLGGSGIVVSLARGIEIAKKTTALLCFDLCVSKNIRRTLEERVHMLGGETLVVDCVMTGSDVDPRLEGHMTEAELTSSQSDMRDKIKWLLEENSDRSDVLGNIQVLNREKRVLTREKEEEDQASKQGKDEEYQGHLIQASIPIERARFRSDEQSAKLLLVELDLDRFRRRTAYWLMGSAVVFGIALFPLSAIGVRDARDDHVLRRAARKAAARKRGKITDPGEVA